MDGCHLSPCCPVRIQGPRGPKGATGPAFDFRPENDFWVAPNGSDDNTGSITAPFQTIQKGIDACEDAFADGKPKIVHVFAGQYTEDLVIKKTRISIQGEGTSSRPDLGTSITGTITLVISTSGNDINNDDIYFSGFLINGLVEDKEPTLPLTQKAHRVMFTDCYFYANTRVLYIHPTGDYRAFVSYCTFSNDDTAATDPLVECNSNSTGMVTFNSNQMTAKGDAQIVFALSGSCRIDVFAQNILTSASVTTNAKPIFYKNSTAAAITLGQNAFVYSSSTAKSNASPNFSSGIYINTTGVVILINNFFSLSGLLASVPNYAVLNSGGTVLYFGNGSSSIPGDPSATAYAISGIFGTNKFLLNTVS
jgi:hypothetical protein